VASLYPSEIDLFVAENMSPYFVRYVDDTTIVTDNKELVLSKIPELRERLASIGITLHPKKFYCQPYQHGVEFLGYHILPGRVHLKNKVINRAFRVAKSRQRGAQNFVDSINSYLGMIKATSDIDKARELLDLINRKNIEKDYVNFKIKQRSNG